MLLYILRRLGYGVITLFFVSLLTFFIIELAPGSAVDSEIERLRAMGSTVSTEQVEALEEQYGANDPWIVKYGKWAGGLVSGDAGMSFAYREPVSEVIGSRLALSLALGLGATMSPGRSPYPWGCTRPPTATPSGDNVITLIQFIGLAIPEFLLALGVMVAAVQLGGSGRRRTVLQRVPQRAVEHGQVRRHGRPPLDAGAGDLGRQHRLAHPGDAGEPLRRARASSSFRRRGPRVSPRTEGDLEARRAQRPAPVGDDASARRCRD